MTTPKETEAEGRAPRRAFRFLPEVLLAAVVLASQPGWIRHLSDGIFNPGDPYLTAWILAWDAHQLAHHPFELFQANIFFPHADTLAFSEHLIVPAVLVAPFQAFGNPILAQNVSILTSSLLLGLVLCGIGQRLGLGAASAVFTALLVVLAPVRLLQIGHLHLLHTAWMPLSLHFLARFARTRAFRDAALATLFVNLQVLSGYYLAMMEGVAVLCLLAAWPAVARVLWRDRRTVLPLLLLTLAVNAPFAVPYLRVSRKWHFERTLAEARQFSVTPNDYFRRPNNMLVEDLPLSAGPSRGAERGVYAGVGVVLLAAFGLLGLRRGSGTGLRLRLTARFAALLAASGALLSFGPSLRVGAAVLPMPFWLARHVVPGFGAIRVASRFGLLADLGICALAGIGLHWLAAPRSRGPLARGSARAAAVILAGLVFVERAPRPSSPQFTAMTGEAVPRVYRWLAGRQDIRSVLFLPVLSGPAPRLGWDPTPYEEVYLSTYHWKPMVNGVSGFFPPGHWQFAERVDGFPAPPALAELAARPSVDALVLRRDRMPPIAEGDLARLGFVTLRSTAADLVLLPPSRSSLARVAAEAASPSTRTARN